MPYRRALFLVAFALAVPVSALDSDVLESTVPEQLCARFIVGERGLFFQQEVTLDGRSLRDQLKTLKIHLHTKIREARAEFAVNGPAEVERGRRTAEYRRHWELVDRVYHVLTRIDALTPKVSRHRIDQGHAFSMDNLTYLWLAYRADELGVKVGLLVSELVREGQGISEHHLIRAQDSVSRLSEAVEAIEKMAQQDAPVPERNRLYAEFLQAAGRAKLREFIAGMKRKGDALPTVERLKSLLPISFSSGLDFEAVYALWRSTHEAFELTRRGPLSDEAAALIVRSATRHGLTPERIRDYIAYADALAREMPGRSLKDTEFSALFDLATTPGWSTGELRRRLVWTNTFLGALRRKPLDFAAVLALTRVQTPGAEINPDVLLSEFSHLLHLEELAHAEDRLGDTALAFLVAGTRGAGKLREAHFYVTNLRLASQWGDKPPLYSSEAWVVLAQVGQSYGLEPEELALATTRLFGLQGRALEAGRVATILGLVMEKKKRSKKPSATDTHAIEEWELAEFMTLPYLRFTLPEEDLLLGSPESNETSRWGSDPVTGKSPTPHRYAIWNWDFNDGHGQGLNLTQWCVDPSDGSFALRLNGLTFDSDGDAVTWRPDHLSK